MSSRRKRPDPPAELGVVERSRKIEFGPRTTLTIPTISAGISDGDLERIARDAYALGRRRKEVSTDSVARRLGQLSTERRAAKREGRARTKLERAIVSAFREVEAGKRPLEALADLLALVPKGRR